MTGLILLTAIPPGWVVGNTIGWLATHEAGEPWKWQVYLGPWGYSASLKRAARTGRRIWGIFVRIRKDGK